MTWASRLSINRLALLRGHPNLDIYHVVLWMKRCYQQLPEQPRLQFLQEKLHFCFLVRHKAGLDSYWSRGTSIAKPTHAQFITVWCPATLCKDLTMSDLYEAPCCDLRNWACAALAIPASHDQYESSLTVCVVWILSNFRKYVMTHLSVLLANGRNNRKVSKIVLLFIKASVLIISCDFHCLYILMI